MYQWIKVTDTRGETYEYEDCEMTEGPFSIIIFFKAPLGIVKKRFIKANLISVETLKKGER